jgi:hypothetical protein
MNHADTRNSLTSHGGGRKQRPIKQTNNMEEEKLCDALCAFFGKFKCVPAGIINIIAKYGTRHVPDQVIPMHISLSATMASMVCLPDKVLAWTCHNQNWIFRHNIQTGSRIVISCENVNGLGVLPNENTTQLIACCPSELRVFEQQNVHPKRLVPVKVKRGCAPFRNPLCWST